MRPELEEPTPDQELRLARAVLIGSFACSILLFLVLTLRDPWFGAGALGLALILAGALAIASACRRPGRSPDWLLSLAVFNLLLVVPELALRAADFRYQSGVQFGYPGPGDFLSFRVDEDLFWTLDPRLSSVNSEGFIGPEFEVPKPEGEFRMLYLGDSCTLQGHPELVALQLNAKPGLRGPRFASVSLAVAGYSSHQGLLAARLHGARLDADLVFVQFGWNDHWRAWGARDAEKRISVWQMRQDVLIYYSRLAQAVLWLRGRLAGTEEAAPIEEPRVTEDEYRSNLLAIRDEFARRNVPVVFVTAPTAHPVAGVPDYLIEAKFAPDEQTVLDLHERYNAIMRSVALEEGIPLLDLDAEFAALPGEQLKRLFKADGIHFTDAGLLAVASSHSAFVRRRLAARRSAGLKR